MVAIKINQWRYYGKIAIKYDKDLTKMAKSILGGVVERAYYTVWDYRHITEDDTNERLKDQKREFDGDILEYDGQKIWIKFTNGKIVEFSNSEWGYICPADTKKSYEVE